MINRLCKFNFKPVRHRSNRFHFERHIPIPYQAFQPLIGISCRPPSAVCFTNKKRAIRRPGHPQYSRTEATSESNGSPLVLTVHLFKKYPGNHAHPLVSNQDLSFRSEEKTSELPSLMRISYAVICMKKKNKH